MEMSELAFDVLPTVAILHRLGQASLKQSLAKAVRLWVILRSLYGDVGDEVCLELDANFSYRDWAKQFFSAEPGGQNYHLRDRAAPEHDPSCVCMKSLAHWLFDGEYGAKLGAWKTAFQQRYGIDAQVLEGLLRTGKLSAEGPDLRLFGCTGKLLEKDFEALENRGWLIAQTDAAGKVRRNCYEKVSLAVSAEKIRELRGTEALGVAVRHDIANFIQTDLAMVAETMAGPIRGVQRFFLHTDYIVPMALSAQVGRFQETLLAGWEQAEVPPIRLVYQSARLYDEVVSCVVYPVCIYYFQRAPYLFAYGQVPDDEKTDEKTDSAGFNWYDYRLDHIQQMEVINWGAAPLGLAAKCLGPGGPSPAVVQDKMLEAWGFDFYRPTMDLVLRFDQYFYARYVEHTERATFLSEVSHRQVEGLVRRAAQQDEQLKGLVAALRDRSVTDVYRRVRYRVGDNNVVMRLRAWGENVEVILPGALRRQMRGSVGKLWKLYGEG